MRKVTAVSDKKSYVVEIDTDKHQWIADEPPNLGGTDAGPAPYELLLSGVAACTAITSRMYAERKGWPLESIRVEVEYSRVRAEECADCETEKGFVSQIGIQISLEGALDNTQRQRIFEIAGKCPVKRTLEGEVRVMSKLLEGD